MTYSSAWAGRASARMAWAGVSDRAAFRTERLGRILGAVPSGSGSSGAAVGRFMSVGRRVPPARRPELDSVFYVMPFYEVDPKLIASRRLVVVGGRAGLGEARRMGAPGSTPPCDVHRHGGGVAGGKAEGCAGGRRAKLGRAQAERARARDSKERQTRALARARVARVHGPRARCCCSGERQGRAAHIVAELELLSGPCQIAWVPVAWVRSTEHGPRWRRAWPH